MREEKKTAIKTIEEQEEQEEKSADGEDAVEVKKMLKNLKEKKWCTAGNLERVWKEEHSLTHSLTGNTNKSDREKVSY